MNVCPACRITNTNSARFCAGCGVALSAVVRPESDVFNLVLMIIFVIGALLLLITGFFSPDISAVQQTAFFAAAAVCAIFARIAQAGVHHTRIMNEWRRR